MMTIFYLVCLGAFAQIYIEEIKRHDDEEY